LYHLCQVLYNVALPYIEAKSQQPSVDQQQLGNEFDMYLSQLGFMPSYSSNNNSNGNGDAADGQGGPPMMDENMADLTDVERSLMPAGPQHDTGQLGDWFSGNNYMMGLLDEDFSGLNPPAWPA
jgi:hypothetical protein